MIKTCFRCKLEKPIDDFGSLKRSPDGKRGDCKTCRKSIYYSNHEKSLEEKSRDYYKHKESRLNKCKERYEGDRNRYIQKSKEYYANNKEKRAEQSKVYRAENAAIIKQKKREYYQRPDVKAKNKEKSRLWKENNPEKRREMEKRYFEKNPIRKVIRNMRNRIYCVLKRNNASKADHTIKMLGCTPQFLKDHIESQFYNYTDEAGRVIEMTWDNLGNGPGTFQIDHIVALCLFDLTNSEEQHIANHWTTLQPLWFHDHDAKNQSDLLLREEFEREGKTVSLVE